MVTHASDASFTPDPPKEDLADKVAAKINSNLIEEAYGLLKTGVNNVFSGADSDGDGVVDKNRSRSTDVAMITPEREAYMQKLTKELQDKVPGGMEKLSAPWLREYYQKEIAQTNPKDGTVTPKREFNVSEVEANAKGGLPFDKPLAQASLKDIQKVASLNGKPDVIDYLDVLQNGQRVKLEPREEFAKRVIDGVTKTSETDLVGAYKTIKEELQKRHSGETPSEIGADEKALADAIHSNQKLEALLSSVWLRTQTASMWDNTQSGISMRKLQEHQNQDYVDQLFNKHVIDNFGTIARSSTERQNDQAITPDEINNYINRVRYKK